MPPRVIKGSPIILDLSEAGGGQLLVGNNTNDNKVFLQGMSANGQANASELLVTGRLITSLPLVSVLADITRILGHLQIGEGFNPGFTGEPLGCEPQCWLHPIRRPDGVELPHRPHPRDQRRDSEHRDCGRAHDDSGQRKHRHRHAAADRATLRRRQSGGQQGMCCCPGRTARRTSTCETQPRSNLAPSW